MKLGNMLVDFAAGAQSLLAGGLALLPRTRAQLVRALVRHTLSDCEARTCRLCLAQRSEKNSASVSTAMDATSFVSAACADDTNRHCSLYLHAMMVGHNG
jgi:hypothetical protein